MFASFSHTVPCGDTEATTDTVRVDPGPASFPDDHNIARTLHKTTQAPQCCTSGLLSQTAPRHFRRALLSKEINMLCNEKRPWADRFLLRATACCLQAPAGAAGQLPQLWLLHRFIERSLKALIVLMPLTISLRFPRCQFDSRGELRPLLAGASAQHWHVNLKLSDSSLCLPFGDFKWN